MLGMADTHDSSAEAGAKYVRYSNEQVQALERLYCECPKPSQVQRQKLISDCSLLHNVDPKQIKVWFQNRRCREKQRKEATRLQSLNGKLTAMNTLLMEENVQLQHQVAHLLSQNHSLRLHLLGHHPPPHHHHSRHHHYHSPPASPHS